MIKFKKPEKLELERHMHVMNQSLSFIYCENKLNPLKLNGIPNCSKLDQSISVLKDDAGFFSFLFKLIENSVRT